MRARFQESLVGQVSFCGSGEAQPGSRLARSRELRQLLSREWKGYELSTSADDGAMRNRGPDWLIVGLFVVSSLALYGGIGYTLYLLVDALV